MAPYKHTKKGRPSPDLLDKQFGRLVVVEKTMVMVGQSLIMHWLCKCDCGNTKPVRTADLTRGYVQSCGCLWQESRTSHGMSRSAEYKIWQEIRQRCNNPKNAEYARYGGSGVKVCAEWEASFEAFYAHMGDRPSPRHQIDRINGKLGYEPGNCHWATPRENTNNRGNTIHLTFNGEIKPLSVWAEDYHIDYGTLYQRIKHGWSVEEALSRAVAPKKRRRKNAGTQ